MPQSRSQNRLAVRFDRQQETWYVSPNGGARLALERSALEDLLALYNGIHRGQPLALLPEESLRALRYERRHLQQTIRQLYDFIDAELDDRPAATAAPPHAAAPAAPFRALCCRLRALLRPPRAV